MARTLGIAAFEFKVPPRDAFARTRALGVTHCEIVAPVDVDRDTVEEVGRAATEHGIAITAVACLSKPNTADDENGTRPHVELLNLAIDTAAALGAQYAITYFGGHPTRTIPEAIERYATIIGPSLSRAADRGVSVLIENHFSHAPGEATNSAQGCVDLIEAMDSPAFALNFDHCNFAIGGQDLVSSYTQLRPYIRNVHVKDARPFNPRLDADYDGRVVTDLVNGDFMFVPVGDGITDNDAVIQRVVKDGLDVPVTVEVHVPERMITKAFEVGLDYCRAMGV